MHISLINYKLFDVFRLAFVSSRVYVSKANYISFKKVFRNLGYITVTTCNSKSTTFNEIAI